MAPRNPLPSADDFAAAFDWWSEAGVDRDFLDEPNDWLAAPAPAARHTPQHQPVRAPESPEPVAKAEFGGIPGSWPDNLPSFRQWWLEDPALEDGGIGPRVPPRGKAGAALMVVVAMPGEDDSDALLAGPQGQLLSGFLRAAGIDEAQIYLASVLPRCSPMPNLAREGIGAVLRHHVRLVAPQRILALGRNILPLIAHETAQDSAILPGFNHDSRNVPPTEAPLMEAPLMEAPLMEARGPAELLRSARARAQLWQNWLDWTDG